MLYSQTLEKLRSLRLEGMAQGLEEQRQQANVLRLDSEERLALLVERQWSWKENLSPRCRSFSCQMSRSHEWRGGDARPRASNRSRVVHFRVRR